MDLERRTDQTSALYDPRSKLLSPETTRAESWSSQPLLGRVRRRRESERIFHRCLLAVGKCPPGVRIGGRGGSGNHAAHQCHHQGLEKNGAVDLRMEKSPGSSASPGSPLRSSKARFLHPKLEVEARRLRGPCAMNRGSGRGKAGGAAALEVLEERRRDALPQQDRSSVQAVEQAGDRARSSSASVQRGDGALIRLPALLL
ncbi:hypothetical protein AOLI_G00172290 [Acnodon oligacanthus]